MTLRGDGSISQKRKLVKSEQCAIESVSHGPLAMKFECRGDQANSSYPLLEGGV
jgi:hypothetical protein